MLYVLLLRTQCASSSCNTTAQGALHAADKSCSPFLCSLKEDKVIVIAMCPGWVATDMGNGTAEQMNTKPPLDPHTSIAGQQRVIAGLTLEDSGRFVTFENGNDIAY